MWVITEILGFIDRIITVIVGFIARHYPTIIGVAYGVCSAIVIARLLRRLHERTGGGVGRSVILAAALFVVMLVAVGRGEFPPNTEVEFHVRYLFALAVLVGAGLGAPRILAEGRWSPALMLLTGCLALVGTLWVVETGIRGSGVVNESGGFLTKATVAGVLAMASIQCIRSLLPVRGAFHRVALQQWIEQSASGEQPDADKSQNKLSVSSKQKTADQAKNKNVLGSIIELASAKGTERFAFFDLPIEQLCGQIAAGADRLLDHPSKTLTADASEVLSVLAGSDNDVHDYIKRASSVATPPVSQPVPAGAAPIGVEPPPDDKADKREQLRLRAILSQRIQGNVDRLQIDTTFWWKRVLRGIAFAMSVAVGLALGLTAVPALACGFVGGFVAMLSRDLVAIVEKARR
jgi:hypothetical protein